MNKSLTLLAAGITALLTACGDSVVESYTPETPVPAPTITTAVDAQAKLNVLVVDGSSGQLIADAEVALSTGKTATTSADGKVSFDSVAVGSHELRIEKAGYAPMVAASEIEAQQTENVFQAFEKSITVQLYPLNASLEGYLRYYDYGKNSDQPAAGAVVRLVLNGGGNAVNNTAITSFLYREFQDTVDADGKYEFIGLPATNSPNYSVYALEYIVGGIIYPTQELNCNTCGPNHDNQGNPIFPRPRLLAASSGYFGRTTYSNNNSLFEVSSRPDEISDTSSIVFEFNDSIDIAKFSSKMVTISPALDFDVAVVGKKITLKPKEGLWKIDPNVNSSTDNLTVSFSGLRSVKGITYNGGFTVSLLLDRSVFTLLAYSAVSDTSNVVFTFSDSINTAYSKYGIKITNSWGRELNRDADYERIVAGKTLTIKPKGGSWSLINDGHLTNLDFQFTDLPSVKGKRYNGFIRIFLPNQYQFTLQPNYKTVVGRTDPLVFEFSDSIDVSKITQSSANVISQRADGFYDTYDVVYGGKTVTIKPHGKWNTKISDGYGNYNDYNNYNGTFLLVGFDLVSVKGIRLVYDKLLINMNWGDLSNSTVTGLKNNTPVTYTTTQFSLEWNKVEEAQGYTLFARASKGYNNFIELTNYGTLNADDTVKNVNMSGFRTQLGLSSADYNSGLFANGNDIEFLVQAYNPSSKTPLNGAQTIKVYDVTKPTVTTQKIARDSTLYFYGWREPTSGSMQPVSPSNFGMYGPYSYNQGFNPRDYLFVHDTQQEWVLYVSFNKQMDINADITGGCDPEIPRVIFGKREWISETELLLTLRILAGDVLTAEKVESICSISGLKDQMGNALEINYGNIGTYIDRPLIKNTLDFRLLATNPNL
jgi:hypothetical protein